MNCLHDVSLKIKNKGVVNYKLCVFDDVGVVNQLANWMFDKGPIFVIFRYGEPYVAYYDPDGKDIRDVKDNPIAIRSSALDRLITVFKPFVQSYKPEKDEKLDEFEQKIKDVFDGGEDEEKKT